MHRLHRLLRNEDRCRRRITRDKRSRCRPRLLLLNAALLFGLCPLSLTGAEVDAYVKQQVAGYRKLAQDFGLAVTAAK